MQNSVERLTEKIHEVAYSLFTYLTPRINRHFTAALLRKGEKRLLRLLQEIPLGEAEQEANPH